MPLSLAQLRTPMTRDECLTSILSTLSSLGFAATSWQTGSVQRTLLTAVAQVWSDMTNVVDALSRAGFNEDAEDDALTAFSSSHYDNTRNDATYTEGVCTLTCSAAAGPYAIVAGQLQVSDTVNGYTYRNTTGGLLASGGTLSPTFKAEVAGAARNVANSTITTLNTSLAGVTVNNPDPGTGTWITTYGSDAEADAALRARNSSRWATLSYASPGDAYEQFARVGDVDVARVRVDDDNPFGPGTLVLYCARTNGTATGGDVANVQAYVDTQRPCTSDITVLPAVEVPQNFAATIYIDAAYNTATTQAAIVAARDAYLATLPIGGVVLPPGATGYLIHSELSADMTNITGVRAITWTAPTGNVALGLDEVMIAGATAFTYTSV